MKTICQTLKRIEARVITGLALATTLSVSSMAMADTPSGNSTTAVPVATAPTASIPTGASPELTEFLQNRALLAGKEATVNTSDSQALAQFQQQNADLLKRQAQLAQILSQQQTAAISTPPPLQIPPNATPQLKALLIARDQFARDEIAFINQHLNDDPATKAAALQQWQQQNAARHQHLQQMAQAISTSNQ